MAQDLLPLAFLLAAPPAAYAALRLSKARSGLVEASPIHLIVRTKVLNGFLNEAPKRHLRLASFMSHVLLACFPVLIVFFFLFFGANLLNLVGKPAQASQVSLVIPGVTLGLRELPYVTAALFVGMVFHEFAHGFVGSSRGIPIKSVGVGLFLSLGFALVEFDDEGFKKVDRGARIRALAAGPSANVIVSAAAILALGLLSATSSGVVVLNAVPPASSCLRAWDVVTKINGTSMLSDLAFRSYMANVKPGDLLVVQTLERVCHVRAGTNPYNSSRGYLGISVANYLPALGFMGLKGSYEFVLLVNWIGMANLSLAIVNVAPVDPLDGGKIMDELFSGSKTPYARALRLAIFSMTAFILVGNFVLSAYRFGL